MLRRHGKTSVFGELLLCRSILSFNRKWNPSPSFFSCIINSKLPCASHPHFCLIHNRARLDLFKYVLNLLSAFLAGLEDSNLSNFGPPWANIHIVWCKLPAYVFRSSGSTEIKIQLSILFVLLVELLNSNYWKTGFKKCSSCNKCINIFLKHITNNLTTTNYQKKLI